uniref:CX domain-containing protein n=1 Tax=Haemonchus contortus TaxID=6289 RepID=A0A7I4YVE6_HAECO
MLSISLLFIVELFNMAAGKRNEIGHIPMKGNLWRAKQSSEISPNVSIEFAAFAKHCRTTTSEDTGITYHYSPNGTVYSLAEEDQTICAYSLERTVPNEFDTPNIYNFTLYFVCDDTCCAMECCQRDVEMTIIGATLIGISVCILGFYASVYFGGLICAWKNGALGRRHTVSARSPSHRKESSIVLKNGTFDTC